MVLVFRTSVNTHREAERLNPLLDRLINAQGKWNFDLEDCDRILRVLTQSVQASVIEKALHEAGFFCEELEDE